MVREIRGANIGTAEWTPADFGLEPCKRDELYARGPEESAQRIRGVLAGQGGAATRIVLANAAAALLAAERVSTLREGVANANESITSGRALNVLTALVECS
jgi:anthranilate phosphoribosyltransferase